MTPDQLYPLKFQPILKDRLWGGSRLGSLLGKPIKNDQTGESWEISGVPGNVSIVANGLLKGKTLQELIDQFHDHILGEEVVQKFGREFPILIKFIDAERALSIQLHPGDELAQKRHQSFGKTEMWYIMNAKQDANLIVGFKKDMTPEEYKSSLENDTLLELLNYESVKEGDTFFINTGKVHAIGGGILLAEIQQTSDITYRIFDFNRRDSDGKLRELHTDLALDAIDYKKKDDFKVLYKDTEGLPNMMVSCPYFTTNYLKLTEDKELDLSGQKSFSIYICVAGSAIIRTDKSSVPLVLGETVLIPAIVDSLVIQTQQITLLQVTI